MCRRILVADADKLTHILLAIYFEVDIVDHAGSALEALDRLRSYTYDLLIVDERLPGMTGSEMLRRLGSDRPPAVGMSVDPTLLDHLQAAGCAATLPKPFSSKRLHAVVKNLAPRRPCGPECGWSDGVPIEARTYDYYGAA